MKCFNCDTEMKCVDDIVYTGLRVDFEECSNCGATATIVYDDDNATSIREVSYNKGKKIK